MKNITMTFSKEELKFLSTILGHIMAFMLNFKDTGIQGSEIDKLKVKIDQELDLLKN